MTDETQLLALAETLGPHVCAIKVHAISGPGILKTKTVKPMGFIPVAEMSSAGTLVEGVYTENVLKMCNDNPTTVAGLIGQKALLEDRGALKLTPGIQFAEKNDNLDQQYNTPESVFRNGTDAAIIGRGIYASKEPLAMVKMYQKALWELYEAKMLALIAQDKLTLESRQGESLGGLVDCFRWVVG